MKSDGSGDGPVPGRSSGGGGGGSIKIDSSNSSSPLQIFVQAKKSINDIFTEIEEYIKETCVFVHGKHTSSILKWTYIMSIMMSLASRPQLLGF